MKYERLTGQEWSEYIDLTQELGYSYIYKRLYELENKIEQGTLIELPTMLQDKQGDWRVYFYSERYGLIDCYVYDTREEAEKRLKELQNDPT